MNVITRTRLISVATSAVFLVSFFGTAAVAQAAPLTTVQIDSITGLLQAFGADPSVIANVQAALMGLPSSPTTSSTSISVSPNNSSFSNGPGPFQASSSCSVLSSNLSIGARGTEVEQLQSFLSKNGAGVAVTGYYGPLTEDAVRRWQAANNIVATGTPNTTGFGTVGPLTRGEMDKKMEIECESENGRTAIASSTEAHSSESGTVSSTTSSDSRPNTGSSDN